MGSYPGSPGPAVADGDHPSGDLLAGYAAGSVERLGAWSVEAHVTGCTRCRLVVSERVDPKRLGRNRDVMLVRLAAADGGWVRRSLARCGVPEHLVRLIAATPSLRLSWLLSVVGALAVVTGDAAVAARLSGGPVGRAALSGYANGQVLLPFVLAAPLLALAVVAGAFLPVFDPAYRLALAAPFSGFTLLLVRVVSALAAALLPVLVAAFVVPGPGWLPVALLLPSLALCAFALAAAVTVGPREAAVVAAAAWATPVLLVARSHSPLLVLHWHGQIACAGVLVCAVAVLAASRDRFEIGWTR